MIQTILQYKRCLAAGPILLLFSVFGCGTGEYEQRLSKTAVDLKKGSVFADMKPAATLSGAAVKIPGSFQSEPRNEETQIDGAPIDPRRVKPPKIVLPGLQVTYEEFPAEADSAGGKVSYYCYLGTVDATVASNVDPLTLMQRQAQSAFPGAAGAIKAVQCSTPQGQTIEWKTFQCTGDQEFYYVDKDGNADFRTMPGTMDLYSRQEGNTRIIIGWRVPIDPNGTAYVDIQASAMLVAGSVTAQ